MRFLCGSIFFSLILSPVCPPYGGKRDNIDTLKKFSTIPSSREKIILLAPWVFRYVGNDLETFREYLFKFLASELLEGDSIINILDDNRQILQTVKKTKDFKRKIKLLAGTGDKSSKIWMLAKYWKIIKHDK